MKKVAKKIEKNVKSYIIYINKIFSFTFMPFSVPDTEGDVSFFA